jgi:hypothetical protein
VRSGTAHQKAKQPDLPGPFLTSLYNPTFTFPPVPLSIANEGQGASSCSNMVKRQVLQYSTGETTGAVGRPGLLTCQKVSMYWGANVTPIHGYFLQM